MRSSSGAGPTLIDHLKLGVAAPRALVDISRLPMDSVEEYGGEQACGSAPTCATAGRLGGGVFPA
jgi:CO/xanthine dehydrogenase FAD-binding subunit